VTAETKALIKKALIQYRGDNYERASHAFRRLTPTEMQQQYGASGQTCQEILDGYRQHAKAVDHALLVIDEL
jgi:hypothetical protein